MRSPTLTGSWAAVLAAVSLAAAQKTTLNVGGQAVQLDTVKVGGRTYVALDQLQKALGAAGGANQIAALLDRFGEA